MPDGYLRPPADPNEADARLYIPETLDGLPAPEPPLSGYLWRVPRDPFDGDAIPLSPGGARLHDTTQGGQDLGPESEPTVEPDAFEATSTPDPEVVLFVEPGATAATVTPTPRVDLLIEPASTAATTTPAPRIDPLVEPSATTASAAPSPAVVLLVQTAAVAAASTPAPRIDLLVDAAAQAASSTPAPRVDLLAEPSAIAASSTPAPRIDLLVSPPVLGATSAPSPRLDLQIAPGAASGTSFPSPSAVLRIETAAAPASYAPSPTIELTYWTLGGWPLRGWPERGWPERGWPDLPTGGGGGATFDVIDDFLGAWTVPGTYMQRLMIDVHGPNPYATGGFTLDLSSYFDTVLGPSDAGEQRSGSFYEFLTMTTFSDPAALTCVAIDGSAEVGAGLDLSTRTWRMLVWGHLVIP